MVAAQFNAAEKVIDAQIAANQDSQWLGSQGLPMYYPTQAALVAAYDVAREAEKKAKEQEALNDAYQSFKQADQQSMQEYEAYQGEQEQEKHRQKDVDQSSKPVDSSSWWNKLKEKVSSFVDEKIVQPVQYFGYVMESDPNPKGNLFGQGGITVANNVLSIMGSFVDEKVLNGKLSEFKQTFRTPLNVLSNSLDLLAGAGAQLLDNSSLGLFGKLTGIQWENGSDAFLYGRNFGQTITKVAGTLGIVQGALTVLVAVDTLLPTISGGTLCAVLSGGGCIPLGAAAVAAEIELGMVGVLEITYSGLVLNFAATNPPGEVVDKTLSYGTNTGITRRNSDKLRQNLHDVGIDCPSDEYQAHHIVPSRNPNLDAIRAREILNKFGIDINSAKNGIYIPGKLNGHFNNKDYMKAVADALSKAENREEALTILDDIRNTILIKGDYP